MPIQGGVGQKSINFFLISFFVSNMFVFSVSDARDRDSSTRKNKSLAAPSVDPVVFVDKQLWYIPTKIQTGFFVPTSVKKDMGGDTTKSGIPYRFAWHFGNSSTQKSSDQSVVMDRIKIRTYFLKDEKSEFCEFTYDSELPLFVWENDRFLYKGPKKKNLIAEPEHTCEVLKLSNIEIWFKNLRNMQIIPLEKGQILLKSKLLFFTATVNFELISEDILAEPVKFVPGLSIKKLNGEILKTLEI